MQSDRWKVPFQCFRGGLKTHSLNQHCLVLQASNLDSVAQRIVRYTLKPLQDHTTHMGCALIGYFVNKNIAQEQSVYNESFRIPHRLCENHTGTNASFKPHLNCCSRQKQGTLNYL